MREELKQKFNQRMIEVLTHERNRSERMLKKHRGAYVGGPRKARLEGYTSALVDAGIIDKSEWLEVVKFMIPNFDDFMDMYKSVYGEDYPIIK